MRVNGRYELLDKIGTGSAGVVYGARDLLLHRFVALKILHDSPELGPERREELLKGMRGSAALVHPNLVTVFEIGESKPSPYIAMEFLEGMDLAQYLLLPRKVALVDKLESMRQVCDALHFAHSKGVLHGRIKPSKIFLQDNGVARLLDLAGSRWPVPASTISPLAQGASAYLAPEVILGGAYDVQAELFSVACVFFEFISGKHPFAGTFIARRIAEEPAGRLRGYEGGLCKDLDQVFQQALSKTRRERFQSAAELASALQRVTPIVATRVVPTPGMAPVAAGRVEIQEQVDERGEPAQVTPVDSLVVSQHAGRFRFGDWAREAYYEWRRRMPVLTQTQRWAVFAVAAAFTVVMAALFLSQSHTVDAGRIAGNKQEASPGALKAAGETPDAAWMRLMREYPPSDADGSHFAELRAKAESLESRYPSLRSRANLELASRSLQAAKNSHRRMDEGAAAEQLGLAAFFLSDLSPAQLSQSEIDRRDSLNRQIAEATAPTAGPVTESVSAAPTPEPESSEHRIQESLKRVNALYEEGKYSEGLKTISQILAIDPDNAEARRERARFRSAMELEAQFASSQ